MKSACGWSFVVSLSLGVCLAACGGESKDQADSGEPEDASTEPATIDSAVEADAGADAAAAANMYLGAAGIGVSDLDASFQFYTEILGMSLRYELMVPNYANEKILYFKDSKASDVVLMAFTDGRQRNYRNNPVKLVFYVPDATALIETIRAKGLPILAEPTAQAAFGGTVVAFARDPDGYVLEIIEDQKLTVPYLGAVGLGVADLDKSKDFYTRLLSMHSVGDLIRVPNVWDEWLMAHDGGKGSSVVLLHYTDNSTRNYVNVPVKTVHFFPDVRAVVGALEREGFPILAQPTMYTVQGKNVLIALARDPDGYVLELVTVL